MEAKKTPEADLENKRTIFFLIGFAVVLSIFYVLMEWKSADSLDYAYSPELLVPAFIEKEFDANFQPDIEDKQMAEQPEIDPVKEEDKHVVYEGYQIVEEILQEEQEKQDSLQAEQMQNLESESEKNTEVTQALEADTAMVDAFETDAKPQFPGGNTELIKFIYSRIQYPSAALKQRIQGRVWCSFIVNQDGAISDVVLEQGIYVFLDEEAVRVLKMMPPWISGKKQGKNVRMKVYLPIVFKI